MPYPVRTSNYLHVDGLQLQGLNDIGMVAVRFRRLLVALGATTMRRVDELNDFA
jgi:hypothetical protein